MSKTLTQADFENAAADHAGDDWLTGPLHTALTGMKTGRFSATDYTPEWNAFQARKQWRADGDLSRAEIICMVADDRQAILDEAARRERIHVNDVAHIMDQIWSMYETAAFVDFVNDGKGVLGTLPLDLEWAVTMGLVESDDPEHRRLTDKGRDFYDKL